MPDLNLSAALIGGFLSFFSPCMLPILPAFLSYISGISVRPESLKLQSKSARIRLIGHTLLFALGFSLLFLILGGLIGLVGDFFFKNSVLVRQIGGVFLILFGIYTGGWIQKNPFVRKFSLPLPAFLNSFDYFKSFATGFIFAASWSPCYGPIIGGIFALVAFEGSFWSGIQFFGAYSIGFTIPLLLSCLFLSSFIEVIKKTNFLKYFSALTGAFLIFLGILLLMNDFSLFAEWFYRAYDFLGLTPTF